MLRERILRIIQALTIGAIGIGLVMQLRPELDWLSQIILLAAFGVVTMRTLYQTCTAPPQCDPIPIIVALCASIGLSLLVMLGTVVMPWRIDKVVPRLMLGNLMLFCAVNYWIARSRE